MNKFLLSVALLFSMSVFAAQPNCSEVATSQQVDACAKLAKESADSNLNESYRKLMVRVNSQYQASPELGGGFIAKLKDSQRAWLKLRDANCALEAFEVEVGPPAYVTTINNCVARMSLVRSVYLDKML
ncbi:lysozyme inhibitor LprI family protein [Pseudomonas sp. MWU13-2100]|uniref:lysozyme inhibitor LprI family protein n=1 Tax=Pseudomonas sp. MWU13-2100 TaxID=2935075 RepID=UPI00200ED35A|nr:lysozyme inhibitor LprI family protein [Pseudomonas sp. MWU13-2100]